MQKLLRFARLYCTATTGGNLHIWAADIVNQAFQKVMGRTPTPAERQIVMAVSSLESGYGKGWGHGQSTAGQGSHNWGAVQTKNKNTPQFQHRDSSAEGGYSTGFKAYPDDVSGAADVVSLLFKGNREQQMPSAKNAQRAVGGPIPGPGRSELIEAAAQQGDTTAFSRAMWYTGYYEGTKPDFTENIKTHAQGIQTRIDQIASALGEAPAWSIKTQNYLPVTNDQSVISKILQMNPKAGAGAGFTPPVEQPKPGNNTQVPLPTTEQPFPQMQQNLPAPGSTLVTPEIESSLWFQ